MRSDGRLYNQLRPLKISYDVYGYAASSVLFELGNTKVFCSITIATGVPPFLKGSGTGWLNAEYAMLPTSTSTRIQRESTTMKKNGRSIEISRLIGRSLRAVIDLTKFGEKTITVDCDVLQADGGTRTACITAAYFALERAQDFWLSNQEIASPILKEGVAAISAGIYKNSVIVDPDFSEDSAIDADFNFVITRSGAIIEVQGAAEKNPISWEQFEQVKTVALAGIDTLFTFCEKQKEQGFIPATKIYVATEQTIIKTKKNNCAPLFSLINRNKTQE